MISVSGFGCNLGSALTAHHTRGLATERGIGRLNTQHITTDKLDTAIRDVINEYAVFAFLLSGVAAKRLLLTVRITNCTKTTFWVNGIFVTADMVVSPIIIFLPLLSLCSAIL